jgi:hypothetical protein
MEANLNLMTEGELRRISGFASGLGVSFSLRSPVRFEKQHCSFRRKENMTHTDLHLARSGFTAIAAIEKIPLYC